MSALEIPSDVTCASCGTRYDRVIGPDQADGCAAEAGAGGIVGYYGSDYDDTYMPWTTRPDWVRDGTICDACIRRLIEAKAVSLRDLD